MKILIKSILLFILFTTSVYTQYSRGKVLEGRIIESEILGREVSYTVYLPFDYDTSERYYPVVYLLHGFGGHDIDWIQFGEANLQCDKAIAENSIPPMILVMPDGENTWYMNNYDGSIMYEDFFINEFIPKVESEFRIRSEKRWRGIAGLSMGGHGALFFALKYPDLFQASAAFSAGTHTKAELLEMDLDSWNLLYKNVYINDVEGDMRINEHFAANDVLTIVRNIEPEKLRFTRFYIDCGDDDFLIKGNMELHSLLIDKQVQHEFRVRDGGHQWSYWRSGLIDGLKFIGIGFHQQ